MRVRDVVTAVLLVPAYLVGGPLFGILFFLPALFAFATVARTGQFPHPSYLPWAGTASIVGWIGFVLLFEYEYYLRRTNPLLEHPADDDDSTVSPAYEAAIDRNRHGRAALIAFVFVATVGMRGYLRRSHRYAD